MKRISYVYRDRLDELYGQLEYELKLKPEQIINIVGDGKGFACFFWEKVKKR